MQQVNAGLRGQATGSIASTSLHSQSSRFRLRQENEAIKIYEASAAAISAAKSIAEASATAKKKADAGSKRELEERKRKIVKEVATAAVEAKQNTERKEKSNLKNYHFILTEAKTETETKAKDYKKVSEREALLRLTNRAEERLEHAHTSDTCGVPAVVDATHSSKRAVMGKAPALLAVSASPRYEQSFLSVGALLLQDQAIPASTQSSDLAVVTELPAHGHNVEKVNTTGFWYRKTALRSILK